MRERGPDYQGAAVITGGSSGIGAATAEQLLDSGVQVGLIDMNPPPEGPLSDLPFVATDIADEAQVESAFGELSTQLGPIAHLVCAAGIGPRRTPATELPVDDWHRMMSIHVDGFFYSCRSFRRLNPPVGSSVVSIGSVTSLVGMPQRSGYVSAKGAIAALTRSLAVEWAKDGIRVNCVHPGYVLTPMMQNAYDIGLITDDPADHAAMGRLAAPDEIADVITFLLSSRSSFVTGEDLVADGGFTITKFG